MNLLPQTPLVSVTVPTYNRRALKFEAVQSVLAQTMPHFELIVIDDGSTDGSLDVLPHDPRIRVIRHSHIGHVGRLRQLALDAAHGEFVSFLDSDDRWLPEKLAIEMRQLVARPDCGWCFGDYRLISDTGAPIPLRYGLPTTTREGRIFDAFILETAGISFQSILVRRSLALAVGFDPRVPLCEDLDFMIRLAHQAAACRVTAIVAEVREHERRSTAHRYDHTWHLARAFWRYQQLTTDPSLRRACRVRSLRYLREFVAHIRARTRRVCRLPHLR